MTDLYGKAGRGIDNFRSALPVVAAQFGGHEDFKQRATALLDLIDIETALRIKIGYLPLPGDQALRARREWFQYMIGYLRNQRLDRHVHLTTPAFARFYASARLAARHIQTRYKGGISFCESRHDGLVKPRLLRRCPCRFQHKIRAIFPSNPRSPVNQASLLGFDAQIQCLALGKLSVDPSQVPTPGACAGPQDDEGLTRMTKGLCVIGCKVVIFVKTRLLPSHRVVIILDSLLSLARQRTCVGCNGGLRQRLENAASGR